MGLGNVIKYTITKKNKFKNYLNINKLIKHLKLKAKIEQLKFRKIY